MAGDREPSAPVLSIVVPVRYARETIQQTLNALLQQCEHLPAEVIAVVSSSDHSRANLESFRTNPRFRIVEVPGRRSVPQLRGEGIRAARGRLIAITEDHCLFAPGWAPGLVRAFEDQTAAAVGGPVENGFADDGNRSGPIPWAIYFSRYASSMPPLYQGPTAALAGNNACYRREVLDAHAALFREGFWEFDFNNRLLALGEGLWMEPRLWVTHNKPYRFLPYLALRYRHGRCFAGQNALKLRLASRLQRILVSPLIPPILYIRALRAVFTKRRRRLEFLLSSPALLLCYLVWFWGEVVGMAIGPGASCSQTD